MKWPLALIACAGCATLPERASTMLVVSSSTSCASLTWPVDADVSSAFGARDGRVHQGIDLAAIEGTPVVAACDGVVSYASDKLRGYGRLVVVDHGDGLSTAYAHNTQLLVGVGAHVDRGQVIALSGATGRVTAPHLHFELRRAGHAVDPLTALVPRAVKLVSSSRRHLSEDTQ